MSKLERHNIMIDPETWKILKELKRIQNKSISEILREAINQLLNSKKYNKTYFKIMTNASYCDDKENEELTRILDSLTEKDLEVVDEYELHR
ncbi:ribbon-helix-helix protein, CopG family [Marinitoga aeolica]|uniref:Ribbon-helix-helix protein, CopG family n=1 Tax=Marinitoga aeolica TaxID=2809031 RepID=A0ABY8PTR1_9BACT|nr:ribbon-helix-helix protein, CopG family [Marinitoga aeolica]WGS66019.1 ribbon-helix-helix protein, CopG family [Marinitoga aeolica]